MAVEDMPVDPAAREITATVSYVDATAASGIDFRHGGGPRRGDLAQVGSGIAVLDFDGDGHLDLYFVNGAGEPVMLYALAEDPTESVNLVGKNGTEETIVRLRDRVLTWHLATATRQGGGVPDVAGLK